MSRYLALDKVYDGNTAATLTGGAISGVIAGDSVSYSGASGTFDNKNVGADKAVTITGASLSGADAGNYTPVAAIGTTTAGISARPLTATYLASNKVLPTPLPPPPSPAARPNSSPATRSPSARPPTFPQERRQHRQAVE